MTGAQARVPRIHLSVPHMGGLELGFVRQAFDSNWLSTVGPNVEAFEQEVAGALGGGVHAVAVSSGTAALHLVLRAVGVQPGDRVAVSDLTFAGSVFPILYLGAEPVFIDSERRSWNLDPNLVEDLFRTASASGRLPKVLIAVHLYGQHADLDPLVELCRRFGVTLVEDAAESLGATYKQRPTGTTADYSILSFNGNKMITTTGGGMAISRDSSAAGRMRKWANQSREPALEYVHSELGYNYRLSNVLAGIGRGQLHVLRQRVAQRRGVAERYRLAFAGVEGMEPQPEAAWGSHSRWLSVFTLPERTTPNDVIHTLDRKGIEARAVWRPMHTQPLFRDAQSIGGRVAETLFASGVCLPSSSSLSEFDQSRVSNALIAAVDAALPVPA
jgi:pyridoxal phosphate-dependent aminotransferase EpsN